MHAIYRLVQEVEPGINLVDGPDTRCRVGGEGAIVPAGIGGVVFGGRALLALDCEGIAVRWLCARVSNCLAVLGGAREVYCKRAALGLATPLGE
jgi:hypothetical protein